MNIMKLYIKSILSLGVIITMAMTSCKKENISLENNFPDVPVTVANQIGIFIAPAVSTSFAGGGAIKVILQVPASSGRTIKEITNLAVGTAYGSLQEPSQVYITTPIAGNGTNSITFNTTLEEYRIKSNTLVSVMPTAATSGTATSFLAKNFYFRITLDNGQVIVPTYVRVYVDK